MPYCATSLLEMAAYKLNQLWIGHFVGSAFGNDRSFKLGGFLKEVFEFLLNRAGAGDVNLICVLQMEADLLEKLSNQGFFVVVRSVLV